jgi:hypothetical protein
VSEIYPGPKKNPPVDDREGRFKFDDTLKKWLVRICVAWSIFCVFVVVLIVAGVWSLAT